MKEISSGRIALRFVGLVMITSFAACSPGITETEFYSRHPDDIPVDEVGPKLIAEETIEGQVISLWHNETAHVGYNRLLVRVKNAATGEPVSGAIVTALATRQDGDLTLEGPIVDGSVLADENGEAEVGVLFLQPSGVDQTWDVHVSAELAGVKRAALFHLNPVDAIWSQYLPSVGYYIVWIKPLSPQTGDAPLELAIYEASGSGFQSVDDLQIDLYPYMDMGGGDGHSTPYVAPERVDAGLYRGRINFIMAGGWDLTVYLRFADQSVSEVVFKGFTVK